MPEVIRNVFRRKLRTGLTVFGITIGIFTLVVLGAMAEKINVLVGGAKEYLSDRISVADKGAGHPFASTGTDLVPVEYAQRVAQVPGVACVETSIHILLREGEEFSFGMPKLISGVDADQIRRCDRIVPPKVKLEFARGDWWERSDRDVAVLGSDIADELGARLGGTVSMRGHDFRVVGVFQRTLAGADNVAFIPLEDARILLQESRIIFRDIDISDKVGTIFALAAPGVDADALARVVQAQNPDLKVMGPSDLVQPISTSSAIFNFMIIGVAMVALVVGGLAVINTMVMSVSERVREIGIKKAVGATDFDILREYLLEAALIGFLGGAIGLGLGTIAVRFLNQLALDLADTRIFVITTRLLVGSLAFATVLGTLAGFFPSIRAARLKPVEALKAE